MKVFITGITGFVGSHLAEALIKSGHNVYGLARSEKKVKEFSVPGTIIYGDLSQISIKKWSSMLPSDLDTIIHTAGIVHSYEIQNFYTINTQSSIALKSAFEAKYDNLHFIFISSLAASKAVSHYGKSKREAEDKLRASMPSSWNYNIIRPPMVIGPRDPAVLDIYKMVKDGLVLFPGLNADEKTYSFINVLDLVGQTQKLIETPIQKELLNMSYPAPAKFIEIINGVKSVMEKKAIHLRIPFPLIVLVSKLLHLLNRFIKMEARLTPDKIHELKEMNWVSSGEDTAKMLSYEYKYDLESSLKMTLEDYLKRSWL